MDPFNSSSNYSDASAIPSAVPSGRRLLVKVVKGDGLIYAKDPYCIIEMDEPQQKNQTGARQGTNPYWDEHFLLYVNSRHVERILYQQINFSPLSLYFVCDQ